MPGHDGQVADENPAAKAGTDTFSQLLARIFDQLSVSAWLPALISVALALVVAQLSAHDGSPRDAFATIAGMGGVEVVLLVAAVVVLAVFTQAFEFAGIRFLEGYWRAGGPLDGRRAGRCAHWRAQRAAIDEHRRSIGARAVASARPGLLAEGVSDLAVDFLRANVTGTAAPMPPVFDGSELAGLEAARYSAAQADADSRRDSWKTAGDPDLVARWQLLHRALEEFPPSDYRMLPTRIGNIIRAAEDRHRDPSLGRLEIASVQVLDMVAPSVRDLYRQQRRKLNLYCGLVLILGAATVPVTVCAVVFCWDVWGTVVVLPLTVVAATWVSYRAALASARLFALALAAVAEGRRLTSQPAGRATSR
jgi:hypothetical protein